MYGTRLKAERRTGTASSGAARTPAIETLRHPLAPLPGASGNHVFQRRVQAKLAISDPNDIYEQEADRVADQVMRMPGPAVSGNRAIASSALPDIQRRCAACTEQQMEGKIRRKQHTAEAPDLTPETERHIGSLNGRGQPLPDATRAFFEPRFGVDFGAVRVHTDSQAAASARSIGALAYTFGRDVVFNTGQYAPHRDPGRRLLAHELTHVVQQGGIRSPDTPTNAGHLGARPERVSRQAAPPAAAATPTLTITRQGGAGNTFLSSETISFAAQVTGVPNAADLVNQVSWTVRSVSADSGNGNPHTAANKGQFSFTPNPTNRPITGSRSPNAPIQIAVDAQVSGATTSVGLVQDETDIIRQEYVDFGATPPGRGSLVSPSNANFNVGNYSLIVDNGLGAALSATVAAFQQLTQAAAQTAPAPPAAAPAAPAAGAGSAPAPAAPAVPVPVPAINVESGYRNPRRNVAAGSNFPVTSRHVWGSALDLSVAGANAVLWQRLRDAGASAGTSICEDGPTQKLCNDADIDHVHIQW